MLRMVLLRAAILTMLGLGARVPLPPSVEAIGPPGGWPFSIVFHPQAEGVVFVGLHGGGVFRSDDGGRTWALANDGLTDRTVMPLVAASASPLVLFVGTHVGIFKSVDGATHWTDVSEGLSNKDVWSLAVSSDDPRVLYAGTAGGGVFKTVDAGAHWIESSEGLTNPVVWPVTIDPRRPSTVYAGTFGGGVFKSVDAGRHWMAANSGLTDRKVYALAVDPVSNQRIYAGTSRGVFESVDGGARWQQSPTLAGKLVFSIFPVADKGRTVDILAGTGSGIYRRADTQRWVPANDGLDNLIVWPIAVDPWNSERVVAGTLGGGLSVSADRGRHWTTVPSRMVNQVVFGLALDPASPGTIYAGTAGSGVMKSHDGGTHWASANRGLDHRVVKSLAIDPGRSEVLYVAAQQQFLGSQGGVFRTRDGGATWVQVGRRTLTQRVFSLALDPRRTKTVYVGTDGGGVSRSDDEGETWTDIAHGALKGALKEDASGVTPIQQVMHPQPVYVVAIDPENSDVIYAATHGGVFRTMTGGRAWTPVVTGLADRRIRALVVDPGHPTTLYAGAGDFSDLGRSGGVFKSVDRGEHWVPAGLVGQWVLALAIDARGGSTIWAGTDQGVLCSEDAGKTWTAVATGGAMRYVLTLALDPTRRNVVYAGTEGNSVFRVRRPTTSSTSRSR